MADIFVMCSGIGETWGLSVNEAMNFSLPVIISDTCGCSCDLVTQNGIVFEEGNVPNLVQAMRSLIDNESMRLKMGRNSSVNIMNYSFETVVNNLL